MQQVKADDRVTVLYDGLLENGEVFESSNDTGPLEFTLGADNVLPSFEEAVLGMQVGETKSIIVAADQAFGPRQEELVQILDRAIFSGHPQLKPGTVLSLKMEREGKEQQVPAM
ncbi:MAG: FKBP-type peptidyl-prolyl cis-trans isomerase, partial [Desulfobulbaceae bacterium]|nr:FKBP-type peptidyl-prolyl cis-trans isomerase [Desulfobulbaceae bacterium]